MIDETVKSPENAIVKIYQSIKTAGYNAMVQKIRLFTGPSKMMNS
jgi:hypothetical protein